MLLSLADSRRIADAAFTEAAKVDLAKISVVITDPGGHVRFAMRADGQGIFGIETATTKAVSALGFGRSTVTMAEAFSPQATTGVAAATHGRFAPLGGGVVIVDAASGEIVGAAGLSGGLPAVDHGVIKAAVESCGFAIQG